ncbi:hypothetical protein [Rhodococcus phage RGL3]|uniref:Uncharacterized protein n=1 Tax=Rhodococcus phage RGL3 TaxID=2922221 RepID=G9FHK2_9CAUD|nr:tail completion or Neck1 protein [Rhodococcus phage RGL3]AEV52091.1 hypothetical protein [Rhodococcus phage RGL3]
MHLYGPQEVHRKTVRQKGVAKATQAEAAKIAGRATGLLNMHRHSGDAEINTTHGGVDAFVNLDDEAAIAIEFGHFVGGKYFDADEPDKFVPGLHILTRAAYG